MQKIELNVTFQLKDHSFTNNDLLKIADEIWKNDIQGGEIKTIFLYLKPEDRRCYAVINGEPFNFGV